MPRSCCPSELSRELERLGGYLKARAERRARDETLDKLVREVEATTRAQEEIKRTITNDLWVKQKVWSSMRAFGDW